MSTLRRIGLLALLGGLLGCPQGEFFPVVALDFDQDGFQPPQENCDESLGPCTDCDDFDSAINPSVEELCDGIDNDCDGLLDGADDGRPDTDGDSFRDCDDCDDDNAAANPDQEEVCDGFDTDCDNTLFAGEEDADGDTWLGCADDCDDTDPDTHPGAVELCDGIDNDCDEQLPLDEQDVDADTFSTCAGDCDDAIAEVNPDADELCNDRDDDCDGNIEDDEGDVDEDGFLACADDCDDNAPETYPGAPEFCEGIDTDCDGLRDEADEDVLDVDGDGWFCEDCDDADPAIRPDADEICDTIDNDCDGLIDDLDDVADLDGDGFDNCDDCDDTDPAISPAALELCDGIDNDCDGLTDAADTSLADRDGDGYDDCADCEDEVASVNPAATEICDAYDTNCDGVLFPDEEDLDGDLEPVCDGRDCDDLDPLTYVGAPESCDGNDNDCDGLTPSDEFDGDGDSFAPCAGDCDDTVADIRPDAAELCDRIDNDCDGLIDDEDEEIPDADSDGWGFCLDCNEADPAINPGQAEDCADGIDNDCDGVADALSALDDVELIVHAQAAPAADLYGWNTFLLAIDDAVDVGFGLPLPSMRWGRPVVGDFDDDGYYDIIMQQLADPSGPGAVYRFELSCDGSYEATLEEDIALLEDEELGFAIDANGDGALDIATWDRGAPLPAGPDGAGTIWLQGGAGGFTAIESAFEIDAYDSLFQAISHDPRNHSAGDSLADIIWCGHAGANSSSCGLVESLGDGTFASALPFVADFPVSGITQGDFNGDGHADLVLGADDDGDPGQVWMMAGDGAGGFGSAVEVFDLNPDDEPLAGGVGVANGAGLGWFRTADLDRDGNLDVVVIWDPGFFTQDRRVSVAWGDGAGGFQLSDLFDTRMSDPTDRDAPEDFAVPYLP